MHSIDIHDTRRAHTVRRHSGAILTLLFVVLTFAGPLWALPDAAPPAPPAADTPAAAAAATPAPVVPLAPVEPESDLGSIVKGNVVDHNFVLRNTGKETLTIERVAQSCGCTTVSFDETIQPGGEGTVRVKLDTRTVTGAATATIEVYAKGHSAPAAVLRLKFNVVTKLLAHPGYARWITVQHEKEGTLGQTFYAADGADFKIVAVESPLPAIRVSFREAKPEERVKGFTGSQWRVEPTLDSAAPVGAITGFIRIETTHPLQKVALLPISGFVRPTLLVSPERSDFGTLHLSGPRQAVYEVRNFAAEPIAVTGVETDVPGISARVESVEKGRRYKVIVEFDPALMKEGPFAGKLRVKTDSAKVPTIAVDLSGTLVRQAAVKGE